MPKQDVFWMLDILLIILLFVVIGMEPRLNWKWGIPILLLTILVSLLGYGQFGAAVK